MDDTTDKTRSLDLTSEPITDEVKTPKTRGLRERRERLRGYLAIGLFILLATVVIFDLVYAWFRPDELEKVTSYLDNLLTVIVGLFGAVTGFYFGSVDR